MRVDWGKRADYIGARHGISTAWAGEAVSDRHAVWQVPDPASQSGLSVRVIGYSPSARAVLAVILVSSDADPDEDPDGDCGAPTPGSRINRTRASTVRSSKNEQD